MHPYDLIMRQFISQYTSYILIYMKMGSLGSWCC